MAIHWDNLDRRQTHALVKCFFPCDGNDRRHVKYWASSITKDSNTFSIREITGMKICGEKFKGTFIKENKQFNEDGIINSESSNKNVHLATNCQRDRIKENATTTELTRNSVISSGTSSGRSKR